MKLSFLYENKAFTLILESFVENQSVMQKIHRKSTLKRFL